MSRARCARAVGDSIFTHSDLCLLQLFVDIAHRLRRLRMSNSDVMLHVLSVSDVDVDSSVTKSAQVERQNGVR